jgi:hypothetical protein
VERHLWASVRAEKYSAFDAEYVKLGKLRRLASAVHRVCRGPETGARTVTWVRPPPAAFNKGTTMKLIVCKVTSIGIIDGHHFATVESLCGKHWAKIRIPTESAGNYKIGDLCELRDFEMKNTTKERP